MSLIVALISLIIAFCVSTTIYPFVIRFAKKHNIVDNPNARKLQREPVPLMGGSAVFIGTATSLLITAKLMDWTNLYGVLGLMTIMFIIGLLDDIFALPAILRFCIEIILVWGYIVVSHSGIDSWHGLWGINFLSPYVGIPLSILAGVGIINSINLIDGVDGYSSGYCIMACICFFILFMKLGIYDFACLTIITVGGLIPFYFHNAFGRKSKMFIGDSGTLMMGAILTCCVFSTLSYSQSVTMKIAPTFGVVAFCLAVLGIPVFDTIRVMCSRILRGVSPFTPDKTHLHHLFIDFGFSHIGCGTIIICMNILIVLVWLVSYKIGFSINIQLYITILMCILETFVFTRFMRYCIEKKNRIYTFMMRFGKMSHVERTGFWLTLQNLVDGDWLLSKKQSSDSKRS